MNSRTIDDNVYAIGIAITAHEAPATKLIIKNYYQRIYYCITEGNESVKEKAYFERELIAPEKQTL